MSSEPLSLTTNAASNERPVGNEEDGRGEAVLTSNGEQAEKPRLPDTMEAISPFYDTESPSTDRDPTNNADEIGTTRRRFVVITVFSLYAFINQVQYVGFATIIRETEQKYNVGSLEVNLLSLLIPLVYCIGVIPGCWYYNVVGMRYGMLTGAAATALAGLLKLISVWAPQYALLVIAQILVAIGQILFLSMSPLVAGRWFPVRERTVATAVGSLCSFFGMAVGMFYSPRVVSLPDKNGNKEWGGLIGSQFGLSVLAVLVMIFLVPEGPSKRPSETAAEEGEEPEMWSKLFRQFLNWNLMLLAVCFGLTTGSLTAIAAVLTQIVEPFDISETKAGILAFAGIMAGAANCAVVGAAVDYLRRYKLPLVLLCIVTTTVFLILVIVMKTVHDNSSFAIAAYILVPLLEFLVLPMVPVGMELSVELTYPAPVTASATLMLLSLCFFSFVGMIVFSIILGDHPTQDDSFIVVIVVFVCCVVSAIGLFFVKEKRKRYEHELALHASSVPTAAENPDPSAQEA